MHFPLHVLLILGVYGVAIINCVNIFFHLQLQNSTNCCLFKDKILNFIVDSNFLLFLCSKSIVQTPCVHTLIFINYIYANKLSVKGMFIFLKIYLMIKWKINHVSAQCLFISFIYIIYLIYVMKFSAAKIKMFNLFLEKRQDYLFQKLRCIECFILQLCDSLLFSA